MRHRFVLLRFTIYRRARLPLLRRTTEIGKYRPNCALPRKMRILFDRCGRCHERGRRRRGQVELWSDAVWMTPSLRNTRGSIIPELSERTARHTHLDRTLRSTAYGASEPILCRTWYGKEILDKLTAKYSNRLPADPSNLRSLCSVSIP